MAVGRAPPPIWVFVQVPQSAIGSGTTIGITDSGRHRGTDRGVEFDERRGTLVSEQQVSAGKEGHSCLLSRSQGVADKFSVRLRLCEVDRRQGFPAQPELAGNSPTWRRRIRLLTQDLHAFKCEPLADSSAAKDVGALEVDGAA